MCNCIDNVEEKMSELFAQENPDVEVVEKVALDNKALMLVKGQGIQLHGVATAKFKYGKTNKNWKQYLSFKHCPFCGEKYRYE